MFLAELQSPDILWELNQERLFRNIVNDEEKFTLSLWYIAQKWNEGGHYLSQG